MRNYDSWKLSEPPWYNDPEPKEEVCDACEGAGWIVEDNGSEHRCKLCQGTGRIEK